MQGLNLVGARREWGGGGLKRRDKEKGEEKGGDNHVEDKKIQTS